MRRGECEHAIRAVGSILGSDKVLVIGSQALHATLGSDLPEAAQRSVEVDIVVFGDQDGSKADLIDGSIDEASMFHETFGYYAQGREPGGVTVGQRGDRGASPWVEVAGR